MILNLNLGGFRSWTVREVEADPSIFNLRMHFGRAGTSSLIPFLADYGGIGEEAKGFLDDIAQRAIETGGWSMDMSPHAWKGQHKRKQAERIGAAIAHTQQCMVEECKIKSHNVSIGVNSMYQRVHVSIGVCRRDEAVGPGVHIGL